MNKTVIAGIFGFIGGFIAGCIGTKMYINKKKESSEIVNDDDGIFVAEWKDPYEGNTTDSDISFQPTPEEEKTLSRIVQEYIPYDEDEEGGEDDLPEEDIRVISEEDFIREAHQRESRDLIYYQNSGILIDEQGERIEDDVAFLGVRGKTIADTTNKTFIYIDNDNDEMLYSVRIDKEEYEE